MESRLSHIYIPGEQEERLGGVKARQVSCLVFGYDISDTSKEEHSSSADIAQKSLTFHCILPFFYEQLCNLFCFTA